MDKQVTIIGAGLAGLTAAAFAARAGARVRVLDAREELGGRARTENSDGFLLNQGAHALYAGTCGIAALRELGLEPGGSHPSVGGWGILRGRLDLLPGTPVAAARTRLIRLAAKVQLGRTLARPHSLLRTQTEGLSTRAWIDRLVTHDDARAMVALLARTATYDVDLDQLDAGAAVAQMVSAFTDNVLYLHGGWQQLVDALREVAERAGAKIESGSKVGHVSELDDADDVILAVGGPGQVASLLSGRSAVVDDWARRAHPVHATALDLGLRRLPVPERRIVLGVDEPLYLSVHTPSARLTHGGGEVVHVLRYGDATLDRSDPRVEMEEFLDRCQPGWRDQVVTERFGRRLVVTHDRPQTGRGLAGRASVRVPDCDGVFIAGDWVGPSGMLADAAIASGRAAGVAAAS